MRSPLLPILALAASLQAQVDQDPVGLLRQVQARVAASVDRLPEYMCTETVDRSVFEPDTNDSRVHCDEGQSPATNHLATTDRLRLDVGIGSASEMYSWVGESRFNDRDLLDMVHEGAISTGNFGSFLAAIFEGTSATFTYNGDSVENGRTLSEFGFSVPYEKSHYAYSTRRDHFVIGYDGTFVVDAKTAALVHIEITTNRLPQETAACTAFTALDYAPKAPRRSTTPSPSRRSPSHFARRRRQRRKPHGLF